MKCPYKEVQKCVNRDNSPHSRRATICQFKGQGCKICPFLTLSCTKLKMEVKNAN